MMKMEYICYQIELVYIVRLDEIIIVNSFRKRQDKHQLLSVVLATEYIE